MILWLDDIRRPENHGFIGATWARTYDEAIAALQTGNIVFASLDHDLSIDDTLGNPQGEKTGLDVVKWMRDNNVWPEEGVLVHSMNPVGRRNMQDIIDDHYIRAIQF